MKIREIQIEDYIQIKGPLSLPELTDLGIQLSEALIAVHGNGIVHRDIKELDYQKLFYV